MLASTDVAAPQFGYQLLGREGALMTQNGVYHRCARAGEPVPMLAQAVFDFLDRQMGGVVVLCLLHSGILFGSWVHCIWPCQIWPATRNMDGSRGVRMEGQYVDIVEECE